MTETLSLRLDSDIKPRLDALSVRTKRSKSFLAAEAIAAFAEQEEWQLGEVEAAVREVDAGQMGAMRPFQRGCSRGAGRQRRNRRDEYCAGLT